MTETLRADSILQALQPDLFVKGIDKTWDDLTKYTRQTLSELGINVAFLGDTVDIHTTDFIERGQVIQS
ncbi:hypothetical protein A3G67_03250 [Candidatus Roizmanbacteria bacterium RIFCSPLOWO2_12_FULL_40_12]|uniref:Uncharacterized protein n=1 Tax=Candidatus Roizmanbacteria bacterium RIFCSPLOWO2_01_FULL_40_42 TaxID=1802066 RepID=A0A1F7J5F8_9BACT|nr:MAG: hypothetical protein A2779_02885 [Candidatus Roizmanbacteria bacterium RIFCSPHIGHO2_01_FULL_40_98]OGK28287.1 MAG: hypothetical protein A3C31_00250 [Candidatus Roizmanbacteria bacterium RIFCSPHIGHO2_02_FULL_40_53]OGK30523.1 MAG: hypothetical protein A2W49_02935 [Candidatus Roizmanbacteria bacterium RIFCSPHIGHO2_12_41_18]OGK36937.1 MAG: hypothetical protein A3E69_00510 [Candidatus Roizmanbacteria bacterium RIFCSPHIGHO2_12_FULL_40_130]OGK50843.1 MAG: hypothetical protein A3B50_01020 [Candi